MPKNTDPAILRQMAGPAGKSMPVPKGAQPVPCILQNEEGKKFFPNIYIRGGNCKRD